MTLMPAILETPFLQDWKPTSRQRHSRRILLWKKLDEITLEEALSIGYPL